jgi:hypothetical protein
MADVKPGQLWVIRPDRDSQWRRTRVVDVSGNEVELQYLDMPVASTVRESSARMLRSPRRYQLVSDN